MRVVQINADEHKRKKVEMFTEARPKKGAGERVPSSWISLGFSKTCTIYLPSLPFIVPGWDGKVKFRTHLSFKNSSQEIWQSNVEGTETIFCSSLHISNS